jgi:hypothetical protein
MSKIAGRATLGVGIAVAGLLGGLAVSANAAQAPNGQWHHDDVKVHGSSSQVKCISMTWPGDGRFPGQTRTADVGPDGWGSIGQGVFHYSGYAPRLYRFQAYDTAGCTGQVLKQVDLPEPEDSLIYWWVTV